MWASVLVPAVAFAVSAWLTQRFTHPASRFHILDHPNERSLHTNPTPRTGGIAIVAGLLLSGLVQAVYVGYESAGLVWLAAAVLLLASTSFADDRLGLKVRYRALMHLLVAAILWFGGFAVRENVLPGVEWAMPVVVALPVTLLYVVWMINLYNFMDGMDGFAGGMAVIGFGALAVLGFIAGHSLFAGLCLTVASAAAGFLLFNFPPARIFMGDAGSSTLGLLAAAFSIWGAQERLFPFWAALLVFSPFIVDATVTLLRRALRGERVWQAHRTHYYQRLVRLGWGHRRTVLREYGLMITCAASAMAALRMSPVMQWAIIVLWVGVYLLLAFMVGRLENTERAGS